VSHKTGSQRTHGGAPRRWFTAIYDAGDKLPPHALPRNGERGNIVSPEESGQRNGCDVTLTWTPKIGPVVDL